jgi:tetratricopeptide (TPR) repeat protein
LDVQLIRMLEATEKKDTARLEEILKDVEQVEGKGAVWLFGQASLSDVKGTQGDAAQFDQAIKYLEQVRKLRPAWTRIPLLMTDVYCQQNKPDQALKYLLESLDGGEREPLAVMRVVQLLARQKRFEDADKVFNKLDGLHLTLPSELSRMRIELLAYQGKIEAAVDMLERSWQNNDPANLAQLCMGLVSNPKCTKALADRVERVLTHARSAYNKPPAISMALGDMSEQQERYGNAEIMYREVLDKDAKNAAAMNNLAMLLAMKGIKLDEALSLANKALEGSKTRGAILDTRACVYIARGELTKALADLQESVKDSAAPVRLFHLAQTLLLLDRKKEAAGEMSNALKAGLVKSSLYPTERATFDQLQKLVEKPEPPTEK